MGLIDKTSGQGPQWVQPEGIKRVSNGGRVQALRDIVNKMPFFKDQMTPKRKSIHERGIKVMPPMSNLLTKASTKPRRPAPPPAPKPEQQSSIQQNIPHRPRSQALTESPLAAKTLLSRAVSQPETPITNTLPQAASIQKATRNLLDHHLPKITSATDPQAQYRELINSFKPSTCVEGDDEFSEVQSALRHSAQELGNPKLADDPAVMKDLQKHFYRRLVTEGAKLLTSESSGRTVKKAPPTPPVRTSSLPGYVPPAAKSTQPPGMQKTPVAPTEKDVIPTLEKTLSKPEQKATSPSPNPIEPETPAPISEISLPGKRLRKKRAALDAPAKYMSKSLTRHKDTPWKEQMPKFFTRYVRAMALTGASEKANVDKQWYNHEVPGASFFSKNSSASDTQKELRHRLEDIAFQEGNSLTGFYRFFDQHQLGRNVRMAAVSQMLLPLSEHGHLDPMTLQDLEPNSGTEVSQWLNQQLDGISQQEYQNYATLLGSLKDRTESQYRVHLNNTPFGEVPLESITVKTHGKGVFRVARVNSFQYTLNHCTPWLASAHPVTDRFAELRLRDTMGGTSQKLTADQLEDLNSQAKQLLNEMSQMNMNKVPKSVQDTMATEKKSLEKIVEKYQQLAK
ncbi:hypothetical protein [Endozoicomonas numazuensis]|uniref:Uncharacterized protein n=1 Tax=Endozoicomonas numazuensis TaxID=1137799 RepID=A0A081MYI3_9GAMM|nr:hypothetical protein [Endozoicomonas numazuensis]KEQ11256.1 hypothetical protein GZ78_29245 [Endozoicomonas numazuensis]KEQ11278.1 hypothetical protein GZ78_29230 [Endozoicomonas numazuensis]